MTVPWEQRLAAAMRQAGWRYDIATNGFRKGKEWVSYGQAEEAFHAAERDEEVEIAPASESVARVVAGAANER